MRARTILAICLAIAACGIAHGQIPWPGPGGAGATQARARQEKPQGLYVDVSYDLDAPQPQPGPAPPFFNCPPTEVAPVIDGHLGDKPWQAQAAASGFVLPDGGKPRYQTQVWMAWDKNSIYLAFRCEEPQVDALVGRRGELDRDISADDYVAVQFEPANNLGRDGYFELRLNCRGGQWDARTKRPAAPADPAAWDPAWIGAVQIGDGFWSAEIEIGFKQLGARPGGVWGINFLRHRAAGDGEGISSWVAAGSFGWVMMGRSKLVLTGLDFPRPLWGKNNIKLTFTSPSGKIWITTQPQPLAAGTGTTITTSLSGGTSVRTVPVTLQAPGAGRVAIKVRGPRQWTHLPTWWMPWEYSMGIWVLESIAASRPRTLMSFSLPYELPPLLQPGRPRLVNLGGRNFIRVPLAINAELQWLQSLKWTVSLAPAGAKPRWRGEVGKLRAAHAILDIELPDLKSGPYTVTIYARSAGKLLAKSQVQLQIE